jgi:hypothetical protein
MDIMNNTYTRRNATTAYPDLLRGIGLAHALELEEGQQLLGDTDTRRTSAKE